MFKRIFALLILLLLLPVLAFAANCTHADENGVPYPLIPMGYIPPQVGVPGYTGDQCCSLCGAVVIHGSEIPALPSKEEKEENERYENHEQEIQPVGPAVQPEAAAVSATLPKTGDSGSPALWIGLILTGIAGLAALSARKAFRKRK